MDVVLGSLPGRAVEDDAVLALTADGVVGACGFSLGAPVGLPFLDGTGLALALAAVNLPPCLAALAIPCLGREGDGRLGRGL